MKINFENSGNIRIGKFLEKRWTPIAHAEW
jgi:hypothetical protein